VAAAGVAVLEKLEELQVRSIAYTRSILRLHASLL
jgi:hypothetical protein